MVLLIAHTHTLSGQVRPLHVLAILTAQLGWALGSLLQPRYVPSDRLPNYTCLQMFAGGAFQLLMGCIGREWIGFSFAQVSLTSWLALAYLVIFGSLIAVNCYSYLLAHVPAQKVSTYALVNPVIALILGGLLLHGDRHPIGGAVRAAGDPGGGAGAAAARPARIAPGVVAN